jgi:hypothetical protein
MNNENIYTYFNESKELIDLTYATIKNKSLKINFVKRWGSQLDGKDKKYLYSDKDSKDFAKYELIFRKQMSKVIELKNNNMPDEDIITKLRNQKNDIHDTNLSCKIPAYNGINEILSHFNISEEKLDAILYQLSYNERICYTYYYGINRKKMSISELSDFINVSEYVIKIYINKANQEISNMTPLINEYKPQDKRKKQSFFDSFASSEKENVLEIINSYKEQNHDYYKVLVKEFGENYDKRVEPSLLSKQEKTQLNNFKNLIKKKLNDFKNGKYCNKIVKRKKQSFFDSFASSDKENVLEIINSYKEQNHDYYKVLVKEFGENYDERVKLSLLSKQEKKQLNNFKNLIKKKLNDIKNDKPLNLTIKKTTSNLQIKSDYLSMSTIYRNYPFLKESRKDELLFYLKICLFLIVLFLM